MYQAIHDDPGRIDEHPKFSALEVLTHITQFRQESPHGSRHVLEVETPRLVEAIEAGKITELMAKRSKIQRTIVRTLAMHSDRPRASGRRSEAAPPFTDIMRQAIDERLLSMISSVRTPLILRILKRQLFSENPAVSLQPEDEIIDRALERRLHELLRTEAVSSSPTGVAV